MRVSTIWDSGTVAITLPRTKIWPLPLPEATPRSASRASPGPLTTQPMTATRSGTSMPSRPAVTSSASLYTSTWARPQAERFQDRDADLDFLHRRGRQGDPDRVADALGQQGAERDRGLDRALE